MTLHFIERRADVCVLLTADDSGRREARLYEPVCS
jgi:hypothetical protein